MRIHLLQYHGSVSSRKSWLAPAVMVLAAVGAGFLLVVTAFFGLLALAVGGVIRMFLPAGSPQSEPRTSLPGFLGGLLKKVIFKNSPHAVSRPGSSSTATNDPKTISLDRGQDGIWRP